MDRRMKINEGWRNNEKKKEQRENRWKLERKKERRTGMRRREPRKETKSGKNRERREGRKKEIKCGRMKGWD